MKGREGKGRKGKGREGKKKKKEGNGKGKGKRTKQNGTELETEHCTEHVKKWKICIAMVTKQCPYCSSGCRLFYLGP